MTHPYMDEAYRYHSHSIYSYIVPGVIALIILASYVWDWNTRAK